MRRPGLIIALGGTGKEVVYNLRKRFQMAYGTPDPMDIRYLFIDTDMRDNEALDRYRENAYPLRVPIQKMEDLQRPESSTSQSLKMKDWFDPVLRQNITAQNFEGGVKGVRMMGRLALLATSNLRELRERLLRDIQALRSDVQGNEAASMLVFVVTSGGGGTGSGTFIDLGYLLAQTIIRRAQVSPGVCETEGIAAIAAVGLTEMPSQMRNSVALIQELDHFCKPENIFQAQYGDEGLPPEIGKQAPYDFITLVSPRQLESNLADKPGEAMSHLEKKIADYVFMRLTCQGGRDAFGARLHDMQQNFTGLPADNLGYPNRYTTFGIGLRQFPIGLCVNMAQRQLIRKIVMSWLKVSETDTPAISEKFLHESKELYKLYEADLGALRDIVGLRLPHEITGELPRHSNADPLYTELIQTDSESLVSALQNGVRNGNHEDLFLTKARTQYIAPNSPGYISGMIERNKSRLTATNEETACKNRTRILLFSMVFDPIRGPRYALSLAMALHKEISADREFILKVQRTAGTGQPSQEREAEAEEEEREVDPLIPYWKPKKIETERVGKDDETRERAYRANRDYELCLLRARLQIYDDVLQEITYREDNLSDQLATFIRYVEQWDESARHNDASDQLLLHDLFEDTVYDISWVQSQLEVLQSDLSLHTLEDLQRRLNEGKFSEGLPRSANGNIDFAPFDPLQQKIERKLRQEESYNQQPIVGISVLRMLAQIERGREAKDQAKLAKLCADLTREGRPLLNLQLGTPGYEELQSNAHFNTATFVWQSLAYREADRELYDAFQKGMTSATATIAETLSANPGARAGESDDPGVIANLFVRGAFPSHVISGYEVKGRRNILFPPDVHNQTTPFTQKTISLIQPPELIDQAKTLLLVAEALRSRPKEGWEGIDIHWDGSTHVFSYQLRNEEGEEQVRYPNNDLQRAALTLAQSENTINYLKTRLDALSAPLLTNNEGYIIQVITDHAKKLKSLINAKQETGYYAPLDFDGLNFRDIIDRYNDWLLYHYKDISAADKNEMHLWAMYDEEDTVWRCKSCNRVQGKERPPIKSACINNLCSSHITRGGNIF